VINVYWPRNYTRASINGAIVLLSVFCCYQFIVDDVIIYNVTTCIVRGVLLFQVALWYLSNGETIYSDVTYSLLLL